MEIKTTTQIKKGLFRFDDTWVRVDDEIKFIQSLLYYLQPFTTDKEIDFYHRLEGHLIELSQSNPVKVETLAGSGIVSNPDDVLSCSKSERDTLIHYYESSFYWNVVVVLIREMCQRLLFGLLFLVLIVSV